MSGVTIIGNKDAKIVGPFTNCGRRFTPSAMNKPKIRTDGATKKVYVSVKKSAL